jgi:hypothetical protein
MDFRFPTDEEDFLVVEDLKDLKSKIKKAKSLDNISRVYFHVSQPKENYLYAYCSACKSKIKYKKHQDSYRLVLFSNHHSHQPISSNQNQLILDYIAQLPLSISLMNKKALIKQ